MHQNIDILIISEDGILDNTGTSQLIKFLFKDLNKNTIYQFSFSESTDQNLNLSNYIKKYPRKNNIELKRNLDYILPLKKIIIGNCSTLSFNLNYTNIKGIIKKNKPKVIYSTLGCGALNALVYKLAKELKIPLIIHVMDDWINVKNTYGIMGFLNGIFIKYYFIRLLKLSKKVLVISDGMSSIYNNRYGIKSEIICNTCEKYIYQHQNKIVNNKFKVGYIGSFSDQSQSEGLIDLYNTFKNDERISIEYWINEKSYENCYKTFDDINSFNLKINKAPNNDEEYRLLLATFDLLFMPSSMNRAKDNYVVLSMPAKLPSYLLSAVPILFYGSQLNEQIKLVREFNAGYIFDEYTTESLRNKLYSIIYDKNKNTIIRNQFRLYDEKFESSKMRMKFKEIIEKQY